MAGKPFPQIDAADRAGRNGSAVVIQPDRGTSDRAARDESIEIVRGLGAALIEIAVVVAAELGAFRRVDAPEANAGAVDFDGVAIDDAGLTGEVGGEADAD